MKSYSERITALAGIFQASELVDQVGREGHCDPYASHSSLFSLLQVNAKDVEAVYDGLEGVQLGLEALVRELTAKTTRNIRVAQYSIQLLQLEAKLRKAPAKLAIIAKGIAEVEQRQGHFAFDHPNSIARFADIYINSVGSLGSRIMVKGESIHLNNPDNANLIRALLLAGIRSAMLWHQCGGSRWQIIFGRNKILKEVKVQMSRI
ncbi:high frequency lysogenization protein HflD [Magnetovirga frankeli]|uniref:high frequency lysogenization protein HflD n=1 Tax=Magnetovirga frankeli TaxID=947516 RepID=UPI001293B0B1|nr:high frequency lysogenization protein HflD [gamma proteobacterium SS-5]